MNVTADIHTKGENYISIVIENVTELKSEYRINEDKNYFTIKGNELTITGSEDKIERIEKWGNGSLKEIHNNKYRKDEEDV